MIDRDHIIRCINAGKYRELAARWRADGLRKWNNFPLYQELNWKAGCAVQDLLGWLDQALEEIDELRKQVP
jgi:hypothetical protein